MNLHKETDILFKALVQLKYTIPFLITNSISFTSWPEVSIIVN